LREKGAQRGSGNHAPWFVARKDMASNTLWAVQGHEHPWLLSSWLLAEDCSWVAGQPPPAGPLHAKTRYRQADAPCRLVYPEGEAGGAGIELVFCAPQWAVTPGQSAVLYDGEVCLGGAVISAPAPAAMQRPGQGQEREVFPG
jgi:tRNA-specific 2-thiouridylase